jgi:hypothetical protein
MNMFHVVDLPLFGVFKARGQYHLPFETENRTADCIFKTDKDFRSTMIDRNTGYSETIYANDDAITLG